MYHAGKVKKKFVVAIFPQQVLNCYLEAYHHTIDTNQRGNLHQAMVTIMGARPRYDTDDTYFTASYRNEVKCLELTSQLLLDIINHQMTEERAYNQKVCKEGGATTSLYHISCLGSSL